MAMSEQKIGATLAQHRALRTPPDRLESIAKQAPAKRCKTESLQNYCACAGGKRPDRLADVIGQQAVWPRCLSADTGKASAPDQAHAARMPGR